MSTDSDIQILVPDLAESIAEADISGVIKQVGDTVKTGETTFTIETDKVEMDVPSPADGTIKELKVKKGDTVHSGEVLGTITKTDIDGNVPSNTDTVPDSSSQPVQPMATTKTDIDDSVPDTSTSDTDTVLDSSSQPVQPMATTKTDIDSNVPDTPTSDTDTVLDSSSQPVQPTATPVAERIARARGIDLASVHGSGRDGIITKSDVENALKNISKEQNSTTTTITEVKTDAKTKTTKNSQSKSSDISKLHNSQPTEQQPERIIEQKELVSSVNRVKLTRRQLTMAHKMSAAQQEAVMTTTYNEVDMTEVSKIRSSYKDEFEKTWGIKLGIVSFFVKACIGALDKFPIFNAKLDEKEVVYYADKNIGVAVAAPEGLVVPVIHKAHTKNLAQIELDIRELAIKSFQKTLSISDLTGGTFTVTNGGVFGSLLSTPIINLPQTGILGIHTIKKRPVAVGEKVEIRAMMYLALTYDHRIVEGAVAVQFLNCIRNSIQNPYRMLLEL